MPLQNFVDRSLPVIGADWLNEIDAFYVTLFASATTAAAARTAVGAAASGANTDLTSIRGLGSTTLTPTNNIPDGSLGLGSLNSVVIRTGGYGQYGDDLSQILVTAATPSPQFDVVKTSWITHTNLTGGAIFGGWDAASTPSAGLGQTFSGGSAIGREINAGNRWNDFGLQADVGGTRYTVGLQIVPDVGPALDGLDTKSVTISVANPGVVTLTGHGGTAGMGIKFQGAGTLPSALAKDTAYYISTTGLTANTLQISTAPGGPSIDTSAGSFVGPITAILSWPGSFGLMQGSSIWGHRWWTGYLNRYDTIMPGGYLNRDYGGSLANQAPLAHTKIDGFWTNGLDFSGGAYSNAVMKFGAGQVSGTATAGGGVAVPATVAGFLIVDVAGTLRRVPYFAV
jgi:hypothetical protein